MLPQYQSASLSERNSRSPELTTDEEPVEAAEEVDDAPDMAKSAAVVCCDEDVGRRWVRGGSVGAGANSGIISPQSQRKRRISKTRTCASALCTTCLHQTKEEFKLDRLLQQPNDDTKNVKQLTWCAPREVAGWCVQKSEWAEWGVHSDHARVATDTNDTGEPKVNAKWLDALRATAARVATDEQHNDRPDLYLG